MPVPGAAGDPLAFWFVIGRITIIIESSRIRRNEVFNSFVVFSIIFSSSELVSCVSGLGLYHNNEDLAAAAIIHRLVTG